MNNHFLFALGALFAESVIIISKTSIKPENFKEKPSLDNNNINRSNG